MKQSRALACKEEYLGLLADAAAALGTQDPYYARLQQHYSACARLSALPPAPARR